MARNQNSLHGFPTDRPLSDPELAMLIAQAMLHDRQNPGQNLPFQVHSNSLIARLGFGSRTSEERAWLEQFLRVNPRSALEFRMAEYCWRLVGLGFLVPKVGGVWGTFFPT